MNICQEGVDIYSVCVQIHEIYLSPAQRKTEGNSDRKIKFYQL